MMEEEKVKNEDISIKNKWANDPIFAVYDAYKISIIMMTVWDLFMYMMEMYDS